MMRINRRGAAVRSAICMAGLACVLPTAALSATFNVSGTDFIDGAQFAGFSTATARFTLGVGTTATIDTLPYSLPTFHDLDQTGSGFFSDFLDANETVSWTFLDTTGGELIYRVSYENTAFDALSAEEQATFAQPVLFDLDVADDVSVIAGLDTSVTLISGDGPPDTGDGTGGGDPTGGGVGGEVPLPASAVLLLAGIGGLGALRRKQRAA